MTEKKSPSELYREADGDPETYHRLMREEGHIIPKAAAEGENILPFLPCGWEPKGVRGTD